MRDVSDEYREALVDKLNRSGNWVIGTYFSAVLENHRWYLFDNVADLDEGLSHLKNEVFPVMRAVFAYGICNFPVFARQEGRDYFFSDQTGEIPVYRNSEVVEVVRGGIFLSSFRMRDMHLGGITYPSFFPDLPISPYDLVPQTGGNEPLVPYDKLDLFPSDLSPDNVPQVPVDELVNV